MSNKKPHQALDGQTNRMDNREIQKERNLIRPEIIEAEPVHSLKLLIN